jgi:hypothetical protein
MIFAEKTLKSFFGLGGNLALFGWETIKDHRKPKTNRPKANRPKANRPKIARSKIARSKTTVRPS